MGCVEDSRTQVNLAYSWGSQDIRVARGSAWDKVGGLRGASSLDHIGPLGLSHQKRRKMVWGRDVI